MSIDSSWVGQGWELGDSADKIARDCDTTVSEVYRTLRATYDPWLRSEGGNGAAERLVAALAVDDRAVPQRLAIGYAHPFGGGLLDACEGCDRPVWVVDPDYPICAYCLLGAAEVNDEGLAFEARRLLAVVHLEIQAVEQAHLLN